MHETGIGSWAFSDLQRSLSAPAAVRSELRGASSGQLCSPDQEEDCSGDDGGVSLNVGAAVSSLDERDGMGELEMEMHSNAISGRFQGAGAR